MGKSGNPAKRAEQEAEQAEPVTYDPTPVDADGVEDFDAFWQQQDRKRPAVRIMGEVVDLPPAIPLEFELLAKRMSAKSDDASVRRCVAVLFGEDRLDRWAEAGMDAEQFKVLLAWAPQRIAGNDVSLAEVAAMVKAAEAAQESGEA
jgi:hypothetical protein